MTDWSDSWPNLDANTHLAKSLSNMSGIPKDSKQDLLDLYKAYYNRQWTSRRCSLDDICILAAQEGIDPVPLARLVFKMGDCKEDIDCGSEVGADGCK
ncbi:MAG: hypothetical protein EBU49_00065 [Proteobacteria bacterium]|nr:hypothetical protein [Pseudomonadota bacterium]